MGLFAAETYFFEILADYFKERKVFGSTLTRITFRNPGMTCSRRALLREEAPFRPPPCYLLKPSYLLSWSSVFAPFPAGNGQQTILTVGWCFLTVFQMLSQLWNLVKKPAQNFLWRNFWAGKLLLEVWFRSCRGCPRPSVPWRCRKRRRRWPSRTQPRWWSWTFETSLQGVKNDPSLSEQISIPQNSNLVKRHRLAKLSQNHKFSLK